MAEITNFVSIIETTGGVRQEVTYEKCDMVTSHTARRSFATNAYRAGIPSLSIMQITGHTTESSFGILEFQRKRTQSLFKNTHSLEPCKRVYNMHSFARFGML